MIKKFIFLLDAMNLLEKLKEGKRVEGVLFIDHNTGRLTFKGYKRPEYGLKDGIYSGKTEVHTIKDMGSAAVMGLMDDHHRSAKNAMIERELIEFC